MLIKDRIQEILNTSGLTASEFSKKLNVQKSRLSHVLSGRNNPSLEIIIKINKYFPKYSLDWLILGVHQSPPTYSNNLGLEDITKKKTLNYSNKEINKIILFYDDKTFETFEK